jgi:putative hemolysin
MTSNASLVGASMLLVVLLAVYGYVTFTGFGTPPAQMAAASGNPASAHCAAIGGALEIRSQEGGETGYCIFADGRVCEEWALYRDGSCVQP